MVLLHAPSPAYLSGPRSIGQNVLIDHGAIMERYDPILLHSIKKQSVSAMKY